MDKPYFGGSDVQTTRLDIRHLDLAVQLLTAPFLLAAGFFHPALSGVALLLLLLPYTIRLAFGRPLSLETVANFPIAILALVFLPLAFAVDPAPWGVTWGHVTTLAWSIALYFTLINWPVARRKEDYHTRIDGHTRVFLGLGLLAAVVGVLGMRSVDKLFSVPQAGFLADRLGLGDGLATNEIAGVLTLFIPFAVALAVGCLITGRKRQTLLMLPLTAVLLLALVLTQSRTGLAATTIGIAVALVSSGPISRKWMLVCLVVVGLVAALVAFTPLRDWFVFAGASSWVSVVGPRLGIWGQALDAIRDQPLWGMGLGMFGPLARFVYPLVEPAAGPVLEDAHNLYLQTALDFGVAGLLVFLVIAAVVIASAVRLTRARPQRTLSRLWAAGLLGALVAHALYSMTDAVALGTLAGIPLWFVFGLVMSASRGRGQLEWSNATRLSLVGALALVATVSALALPVNRAAKVAVSAMLDPAADLALAGHALDELAERNCRAGWYAGLVRHGAGDMDGRAAAWGNLLDCNDDYLGYMATLAPDDRELARRAIGAQPQNAAGYFWLAAALADEAPDEAIEQYRLGVELAPHDGRAWLSLADLLAPRDERAAIEAYLQACENGDPGANGCYRAGRLAEELGDTMAAIEYFRLSNWDGALAAADELERQLAGGQ